MPIYEYECSTCHNRFELLQKVSDEPAARCVRCGGAVDRLFSSTAVQFKGTGWYVTDYAKKGSSNFQNKGDGKEIAEKPTTLPVTSEESKQTKERKEPATTA